MFIIHTE